MREITVDLFAGGGGASVGIERAIGRSVDVAINHDQAAVRVHQLNHSDTEHWTADLWRIPPSWAVQGRPVGLLWASPDCTHHSKAKGGPPRRDSKKRDMAWIVEHWAREVSPRVIMLENVEEFLSWGPLDKRGRVIKSQRGATFRAFVARLRRLGYSVQWRELRACDYGAPTSRKRLFLVARRDGRPIVWPEPTHGPSADLPYRTAAECIDWSQPCPSIFLSKEEGRKYGVKRPLAEKTLQRIAKGIDKFVLQDPEPYVVNFSPPAPASKSRYAEVQEFLRDVGAAPFVSKMRGGATGFPCTAPMHTITSGGNPARPSTGNPLALAVPFLAPRYGERPGQEPRAQPANQPLATITGTNNGGRLAVAHLAKHYGGVVGHGADQPLGSVTARDHHSLVTSHLLHLRNNCHSRDTRTPLPTLTAGGGHVGEVRAFLLKYYGQGVGQEAGVPLDTITGRDRFGVVVTIQGEEYVLADIGMRMLQPRELFMAQGFPADYRLDGMTKTQQVRLCGNSVPPQFSEALVETNFAVEDRRNDWSYLPLMRGSAARRVEA